MIRYPSALAGALIMHAWANPALAQTVSVTAPLADRDGDGKVTLTKALPPFKKGDVLIQCVPLVYAITCPAKVVAVPDLWKIAAPLRTYPAGTKRVWHNSYPNAPADVALGPIAAICNTTCIWAGRASTSTIVRDADLTRIAPAAPGEIDAGFKVGGSKGGVPTAGVLIERVWSHGWRQDAKPGSYGNGDGIVINRSVRDVTIRNSRLDDNEDAGLDTKADLTVMENVSASGNGHYGYRFWLKARATTLTCRLNAWGCIEAEAGADVVIDRLVMEGGEELVTAKRGASVTILSCDLSRWTGRVLIKGQGTVTLGADCR